VFTGLITNEEFNECFRDHRKKIERMAWATEDAKHYLAMPEEDYIEVQEITFASRQSALFVGFKNEKIVSPSAVIGREAARSMIHTAKARSSASSKWLSFGGTRSARRVS
jgi:AbiV family abortive infection protein